MIVGFPQQSPPLVVRLTVREAAIYLGRYRLTAEGRKASESSIYHLVSRREVPVVRRGRTIRFEVKSLDEWVMRDKS